MSDSRYSYDENSEVWPYFAVTLISMVVIPSTVIAVRHAVTEDDKAPSHAKGSERIEQFKATHKKSKLFTSANAWLLAGWLLVGVLLVIIYREFGSGDLQNTFDPYEILDISYSASEKQIKSAYRKLSLLYHPDKVKDVGNSTVELIEARYVDITKAYKALTDETVRENFLKYGHPDGPQQTSHGIALPNFLVDSQASLYVVLAYSAIVGLVLPYMVQTWWANSKAYTKTGIHEKSAATFFELCAKEQPHFITFENILDALSKAEEYKILLPGVEPAEVRKAIDAHLHRKQLEPEKEVHKYVVASRAPKLLSGLLDIASAFKSVNLCRKIIVVRRSIVQAVPLENEAYGELLQLPGTEVGSKVKTGAPDFTTLDSHATAYIKHLPKIHLLKASFSVPGEAEVSPQSQAHLIIKYTILPQGVPLPKIEAERLVDAIEQEDAPIALLRDPISTNNEGSPFPTALAPHFPGYDHPIWYGFLTSERDAKIIDGPIDLVKTTAWSNMSLSAKDLTDASKIEIGTFKIQMTVPTPPVAGSYAIGLDLLSGTYFGTDIVESVPLVVVNPPEPVVEEDDVISDPEENSIAGAIAGARGGNTKHSADDDYSDSEGEEEDLTDIDTDTSDDEDYEDEKKEDAKKK